MRKIEKPDTIKTNDDILRMQTEYRWLMKRIERICDQLCNEDCQDLTG